MALPSFVGEINSESSNLMQKIKTGSENIVEDTSSMIKGKFESSIKDVLPKSYAFKQPDVGNLDEDPLQKIHNAISASGQDSLKNSLMFRANMVSKNINLDIKKKWSENYPYIFHIVNVTQTKVTIGKDVTNNIKYNVVCSFKLPINPQQFSISTPFAINTTVTSRGILEEHNGTPIKNIIMAGTTGILLDREFFDDSNKPKSTAGSVFASTIASAKEFASRVQALGRAAGNSQAQSLVNRDTHRSGYYQYHMLRYLLEGYAELKKTPNGSSYRLALQIVKDNVTYLVTPQLSDLRKDVSSPMEYQYTLRCLAWATVNLALGNIGPTVDNVLSPNQNTFTKVLNSLVAARRVFSGMKNLITSVQSDVERNIFGPMNQVILLAKEPIGVIKTLADFPKSLRESFQGSVVANAALLARELDPSSEVTKKFKSISDNINNERSPIKFPSIGFDFNLGIGLSQYIDPSVLDDLDITDNIDPSNLASTEEQKAALDQAVSDANDLTENEIRELVSNMESLSNKLEPIISQMSPTNEEWDVLYSLNDCISALLELVADGTFRVSPNDTSDALVNTELAISYMDYWEQSFLNNGISFTRPQGKFYVPFPFRGTLEQVAKTYLGDALRWPEIAAVNRLQPPYIDEDGFYRDFLSNGSLNQFNISSNKDLFVGQVVYLTSNTKLLNSRKIAKIEKVHDTNYLITVDGNEDLSDYKTSENAKMKAFLPYTINSLRPIAIPTDQVPNYDDVNTLPITFIKDDIETVKFSKIDLLLDDKGDLAISSDGTAALAYGNTNIIQAAKLKMQTTIGSLLLDPDYGSKVEVGDSWADISLDSIRDKIKQSFTSDPRFGTPTTIEIELLDNSSIRIFVEVPKSDGSGVLPLNFEFA